MTDTRPSIAIIGTGGTIASKGKHPLELLNYIDHGDIYQAEELVKATPVLAEVCNPVVIPYSAIASQNIGPPDWLNLARRINTLQTEHPDIRGVVITHGTATLEETAWFLNLTLTCDLTVVVVGAQRPNTGLSTDAHINLVNGAKLAASETARGLGVLVCLNDEIQAARDVTKTSTMRLQTFRTPDFGLLGHVDHDGIHIYRKPTRRHAPDTEFKVDTIDSLPRVDIVYAYAGADGCVVDACVSAGASAIVAAGFAPGLVTTSMLDALTKAAARGVLVVQSSRAGSGRVTPLKTQHAPGSIMADNLNPQKARILAMLSLTKTEEWEDITRIFHEY